MAPVVDETHELQLAINSTADAGGGTITLPPGQHIVRGTLTLRDYVSLIGTGNTTIRHEPDAPCDLFSMDSQPIGKSYHQPGAIRNLQCIGNTRSRYGISCTKPERLVVEDCALLNFQSACIHLRSAIHNRLKGVKCNAGGDGVSLLCGEHAGFIGTTLLLEQCYLRTGAWAAKIHPSSWYSVVFDNCIFESTRKGIADIGAGSHGITFRDCYSENIGYDGDGSPMYRVGVESTGNKAAWANRATVLVSGGVYSAAYRGADRRLFIESDASRSTIAENCPVTNCHAGLLSTSVYTQHAALRNVTTPQQDHQNFGDIYDWSRVDANCIGDDIHPKGTRRSTATQLLEIKGGESTVSTTLNLPEGCKILGVTFYVRSPSTTGIGWWRAQLQSEAGRIVPLINAASGNSGTTTGVMLRQPHMSTGGCNVVLSANGHAQFGPGSVQVAVAFEQMHYAREAI